jgi:hypothetical protein
MSRLSEKFILEEYVSEQVFDKYGDKAVRFICGTPESPSPREVAVALLLLTDVKDFDVEKPSEIKKDEKPI